MSQIEQNPERRSDSAVLCFSIGIGLVGLSWFLGIGGALSTIVSGGWTPAAAGGMIMFLLVPVTALLGALFVAVGVIWMIVRVIVDQRGDHKTDRYSRDVER